MLIIIIFALSMNVDAFIVGLNYGVAGKSISIKPRLLMVLATGIALFLSMSVGDLIGLVLSPLLLRIIPGTILILLGAVFLFKASGKKSDNKKEELLWQIKLPSLGLMINILSDPDSCDDNHDNRISGPEALFLGFALAIDSFGAGLAFGVSSYNLIITVSVVMAVQFILMSSALYLGSHVKLGSMLENKVSNLAQYIPAIFFMLFGIYTLICS